MHFYPDSSARAAEFQRSVTLPHTLKQRLRETHAQSLAKQCEELYLKVSTATQQGSRPGQLVMKHSQGDLRVQYSGNSCQGSIVMTRGESFYTQVDFSHRSITIFQTQNAPHGGLLLDTAAVVDRRRYEASVAYGRGPTLDPLLQARP